MTQLLEVESLDVQFAGLHALRDVSLGLEAGQITAVIGPNGAGKTTLFNAISGYVRPSGGSVRLRGTTLPGSRRTASPNTGSGGPFRTAGSFPH